MTMLDTPARGGANLPSVGHLLYILTGFLGLAILIAFIGIVNTMALSIFERTRELGLLRAVGMTRNQMHKMVRWEAAIVSARRSGVCCV